MIDREKVIKGLERLSEWLFHQYQVVYDGDAPNYYDAYKTVDDAIALLKEQENSDWISVKDRLPPNANNLGAFCPRYLVQTKYGTTEGWYNPDKGCWYTLVWFLIGRYTEDDIDMERGDIPRISNKIEVTRWAEMPEALKEQ